MDLWVHPYTVIASMQVGVHFVKLWYKQEAKWYYGVVIEGARGPRLYISIFYIYILVAVHCPTA
jgi:hypothetical protein